MLITRYNRSEANHTLIYAEGNNSTEAFRFFISPDLSPCYTRDIKASAGHVIEDITNAHPVDAQFPCFGFISQMEVVNGLRLCGSDFCGFHNG